MKKIVIIIISIMLIVNFLLFFMLRKEINSYKNKIKSLTATEENTEKTDKDYKKENIVFLGDSITDWYPFDSLYEDYVPIVNSGKAGYRTFEILPKLKELVYQYNPTKVFILIGTNDLNTNSGKEEVVQNIEKIIKRIKKNRLKCKIYVQSIYPINRTDNEKIDLNVVGKRQNEEIKTINKEIKDLCNQYKITYIDMFKELIDENGNLAEKYTRDGLHLNDLGYLKITKILTSYIEEY